MSKRVIIIGAGIGGLTTGALLAQAGYDVTVLESHVYPGGCAGTFPHKGYRFDAGATVAGGFQPNGPHTLVGQKLGIRWNVHEAEQAWQVHLPGCAVTLTRDRADLLEQFPQSRTFWDEQARAADLCWSMAAQGLPWLPTSPAEFAQLTRTALAHFPADMRLLPLVFSTVHQRLEAHGLANDEAFVRLIDAQLQISAQTTSEHTNALYGATALDLPRQGVVHVAGGIGGLAEKLMERLRALGGELLLRRQVVAINVEHGRAAGVYVQTGKRGKHRDYLPCDFLIANLTPWSLNTLLGENSPASLRREVRQRASTWGAFSLHVALDANGMPANSPDHHQLIPEIRGKLGEARSIFLSLSPKWDSSRAPAGCRAVTLTTHTEIQPWWDAAGTEAYEERKQAYAERMLNAVEAYVPGFRRHIIFSLPGTPVTYEHYTGRVGGMVGGFAQTSLFRARTPLTGFPNLLMVGDSIFPGQSTAGVTLGAVRVARMVERRAMP